MVAWRACVRRMIMIHFGIVCSLPNATRARGFVKSVPVRPRPPPPHPNSQLSPPGVN